MYSERSETFVVCFVKLLEELNYYLSLFFIEVFVTKKSDEFLENDFFVLALLRGFLVKTVPFLSSFISSSIIS